VILKEIYLRYFKNSFLRHEELLKGLEFLPQSKACFGNYSCIERWRIADAALSRTSPKAYIVILRG
jgi:hypothetical protein